MSSRWNGRALRVLPLVIISLCSLGAFVWLLIRPSSDRTELLRDWGETSSQGGVFTAAIRDGYRYFVDTLSRNSSGGSTEPAGVFRQPIRGGAREMLVPGGFYNRLVTGNELLLIEYKPPAPDFQNDLRRFVGTDGTTGYISDGILYHLTTRTDSEPAAKHHVVVRPRPRGNPDPTLVRIAFSNGKPAIRKQTLDLQGFDFASVDRQLTPSGLLWVRPDTPEIVQVTDDKSPWKNHLEMAAHDTLMFSPFDEKAQVLYNNCSLYSTALPDGVRFTEAGAYPRQVQASYRAPFEAPLHLTPLALSNCGKNLPGDLASAGACTRLWSDSTLVRLKDRYDYLDWRRPIAGTPSEGSADEYGIYLLSWRIDGSDMRSIKVLENRRSDGATIDVGTGGIGAVESHCFQGDGKNLYVIYHSYRRGDHDQVGATFYYLTSVHPDQPGELVGKEILVAKGTELALSEMRIQDGFLYFDTSQLQIDPLDFLHSHSTSRMVHQTRRLRLPSE